MPRYIDADALGIGKADRNAFNYPEYADGWNTAIQIIDEAPTADVVPRAEVSREIFEEIEEMLNLLKIYNPYDSMLNVVDQNLAELKKKYTEGENDL